MKNRILLVTIIAFLCFSCAQMHKEKTPDRILIGDVERTSFQTSRDEILKKFGRPNEVYEHSAYRGTDEIFKYEDPHSGMKRLYFHFNKKTGLLNFKAFIPSEREPESRVDYLLKEKYKSFEFKKFTFPLCGRDYYRSEAMWIDEAHGLFIEYQPSNGEVTDISWNDPSESAARVKAIFACPERRKSENKEN